MRKLSTLIITLTLLTAGRSSFAAMDEHQHGAATPAATPAAPVVLHGHEVPVPTAGAPTTAYLSLPSASTAKRHPAIILIHEWWGLDDWIKQNADHFASLGYVALAIDLYHGKMSHDPEIAHELMRGLPQDRAIRDLEASFALLAARDDVDAKRIASIGWCMGGGYSLDFAVQEPKLAAIVMNYGHLITDSATIANLHPPLLGNFGGKDQGIPPADVSAFQKSLTAAGRSNDIKIYGDAGHGFINPNNTSGYNAADAADAWKRTELFLAKQVGPL